MSEARDFLKENPIAIRDLQLEEFNQRWLNSYLPGLKKNRKDVKDVFGSSMKNFSFYAISDAHWITIQSEIFHFSYRFRRLHIFYEVTCRLRRQPPTCHGTRCHLRRPRTFNGTKHHLRRHSLLSTIWRHLRRRQPSKAASRGKTQQSQFRVP